MFRLEGCDVLPSHTAVGCAIAARLRAISLSYYDAALSILEPLTGLSPKGTPDLCNRLLDLQTPVWVRTSALFSMPFKGPAHQSRLKA